MAVTEGWYKDKQCSKKHHYYRERHSLCKEAPFYIYDLGSLAGVVSKMQACKTCLKRLGKTNVVISSVRIRG